MSDNLSYYTDTYELLFLKNNNLIQILTEYAGYDFCKPYSLSVIIL